MNLMSNGSVKKEEWFSGTFFREKTQQTKYLFRVESFSQNLFQALQGGVTLRFVNQHGFKFPEKKPHNLFWSGPYRFAWRDPEKKLGSKYD